jgi:thiol:disulfide interchange protein DsbD
MKHWLIIILFAGWFPFAHAEPFGDDELLPADQAFSFQATMASDDRIRAVWDIADGYYLYKSKFRFETDAEGIRFADPVLPAGKIKQDEFFGEIETYRHQVVVEIPVIRAAGAAASF